MRKLVSLFCIIFLSFSVIFAQDKAASRSERRAAEKQRVINEIKEILSSKEFRFEATQMFSASAQANTGGVNSKGLSGYFVSVGDGNAEVYLPFVGQSHVATLRGGAIEFKSKSYTLQCEDKNDGDGWLMLLKTVEPKKGETCQMLFDILEDGDTMVQVDISGKESIKFSGNLFKYTDLSKN